MFNWDSILMVINYMLCNDKITFLELELANTFLEEVE